jgi:hypothetical protein
MYAKTIMIGVSVLALAGCAHHQRQGVSHRGAKTPSVSSSQSAQVPADGVTTSTQNVFHGVTGFKTPTAPNSMLHSNS